MAKSLRSKWRRKCRAVKRVRYGVKELARLKKTLGIDDNAPKDVDMQELSEIATGIPLNLCSYTYLSFTRCYYLPFFIVVDAKSIKTPEVENMDDGTKSVYNKKTMLDQNGKYPVWLSNRKISKIKSRKDKAKKLAKKSQLKGKKGKR